MPDSRDVRPGELFVVATPIGNLEDITLRALRVLREVDLIAAEHVPVARTLLRHYDIDTHVVPYHERGFSSRELVERMIGGESVALVCDAGTPGVSDPGRNLVSAAVELGINVVPIPGVAAPLALWSVSGAPSPRVALQGFLPRKTEEREQAIRALAKLDMPSIVFESPRRVSETLADIDRLIPDAELVIGRELTKLYEEIWRGSPSDALHHFAEPRGEFTLMIVPPAGATEHWNDAEIATALADAASQGASRSQAARFVALQSGRARREVYALWPFDERR